MLVDVNYFDNGIDLSIPPMPEMEIDAVKFYHWLLLQDEDRVLTDDPGTPRCVACPIATYMIEALPYSTVQVGITCVEYAYYGTSPYLVARQPEWATYFIQEYDSFGQDDVKTALKIMKWWIDVHV